MNFVVEIQEQNSNILCTIEERKANSICYDMIQCYTLVGFL